MNRTELSDNLLMKSVADGDAGSFDILVSRHQNRLVNYLFRMTRNRETAMDLAQETFIRVYKAADRYEHTRAFSTWLYRIATNLAINNIKRKKIVRFISWETIKTATGLKKRLSHKDPDPEQKLLMSERQKLVWDLLNSMPAKYRTPLILKDIEGLPYARISEIMNLNEGTVKSRLNRGRKLLREKVIRNEPEWAETEPVVAMEERN